MAQPDEADAGEAQPSNCSPSRSDDAARRASGDGSDADERTPVVTFLEAAATPAASPQLRPARGAEAGAGVPPRLHNPRPAATGFGFSRLHSPRRRRRRPARARPGAPTAARSHPALDSLERRGSGGAGAGAAHAAVPPHIGMAATMPALEHAGLQREQRPLPLELPPSLLAAQQGHAPPHTAPGGAGGYALSALDRLAFPAHYGSSDESSSSESLGSPRSTGCSPELEDLWFRRARTFSAAEALEAAGTAPGAGASSDAPHALPRVLTVASTRENDGAAGNNSSSNNNNDGGDNDNDQPPMRLGRELTNDLRNIQLTFDRRSDANERSANPLRHLLRSKHNYRALVTYGGYLFPINILLNVILLGRGWMQLSTPNEDGSHTRVNNPIGYLVTSIISLVLIVCSGVCFVLRCLEFDVMITTLISIVSNFANAALILASAVIYLRNERPKHLDAFLTGEYYSSYAGVAVALLNALLLLLDVLVTPGFRYRGSGMSRQQRMLQFNLIVLVVWIGIGGYAWSKIEAWDTVTSVMFCMVTVTTIGYGNTSPTKTYSRILQLIYGPLGILMFGLMVLNTRNVVAQITRDKFKTARRDFSARRSKIKQDLAAARVKRRLAVHPERAGPRAFFTDILGHIFLSRDQRLRVGIPHWLREKLDRDARHERSSSNNSGGGGRDLEAGKAQLSAQDLDGQDHSGAPLAASGARERSSETHVGLAGQDDAAPHPIERTYTTASRLSHIREALQHKDRGRGIRRRLGLGRRSHDAGASDIESSSDDDDGNDINPDGIDAIGDNADSDNGGGAAAAATASPRPGPLDRAATKTRSDADGSDRRHRHRRKKQQRDLGKQLCAALAINVAFWMVSSAIFYACEHKHWSFFDAMWFCYVSFTTIGYGDIVVKTTEGMIAFICLCFVAVGLETFLVVSGVSFFTNLLSQAMKRTRVRRRIAQHKKGLVAYEIRRHIKHPNYNPFSHDDEDSMAAIGLRRIRRALQHTGEVLRGKRPLWGTLTRHRTRDQRERDRQLAEGFIRHTTGLGGFAPTSWQPPSPAPSFVSEPSPAEHRAQSAHPSGAHAARSPEPLRAAASMPPERRTRARRVSSATSSLSETPEDIVWALF
ncbi:Potassium channel [Coemansia javaensis]|uniref:Potassium channel n=1 Tax=Coemansia javaensis TaxID=2761396 RepID=A0A9W8H5M8_9FUNG|nr:Potassium channel [Coemansia javaensis]